MRSSTTARGNLRSVSEHALDEIGASYELVRDAAGLERATKIVLPGVGHFGQMLRALDEMKVRDTLVSRIRAGVPFLGICLGLQGLFERSEEAPDQRGLAIFPGTVTRFNNSARVPHMGWNQLELVRTSKLLAGLPARPYVYFAHSYYVPVVDQAAALCTYSAPYTAGARIRQCVRRAMPPPKKSGPLGLAIVRNFVEALMLAKRIIPCLDVTAGRVVKGTNFVNLRDAGDPVELADRDNQQGADELVFLDITASSDARATMADVVARTARKVFIPLAVGGGIRSVADARLILMSGADKVTVNTAAVRRPELISELSREFGAQAVVLAIDARRHGLDRWHRSSAIGADATTRASTPSSGRRAAKHWAPARSC